MHDNPIAGNETRDDEHRDPAPLARPNVFDQLAFKRELDRLSAPYESPRAEDYLSY
jgi:hypothetical protein